MKIYSSLKSEPKLAAENGTARAQKRLDHEVQRYITCLWDNGTPVELGAKWLVGFYDHMQANPDIVISKQL